MHEVRPPPPEVVPVLTAARDLPAGTLLDAHDLASVDYPAGTAPAGLAATRWGGCWPRRSGPASR